MATATVQRPKFDNLAALLHQLGDVPLERIRMEAPPGAATEKDVLALHLVPRARLMEDGVVFGADGMMRTFPDQVRIPDVSFISWDRYPGDEVPDEGISSFMPNLAVEVLSPGNTKGEMDRKLRDYFLAGVELVWLIDPKTQTAKTYLSPEDVRRISKTGSLDGGNVLPGFRMALKDLFARTTRRRPKR